MPKGQNLQSAGRFHEAVVEIVVDAGEVQPTHAGERDVSGARADLRLERDEHGSAFKLRTNGP